ncbi:aminotransferase class I/II-fold pyridoxal phosphate-dependent enzyme [Planctomonas sp. JC2975]|uniref:MalY/PatB family protein n=1 Tax=Planctomonas sp. JC2975 TaxID=2729626 RepID=UPI001474F62B|nr:aminotransferase class I/II-fold pyridoxal phosphate-dependent enzyme [Planctomonas sp. JC2975]NNC11796.1 aminotransferase class I/II-fold pyridoxal phosphate-dependent enzyme [Planctomonas sp. JC2975]
MDRVAAQPLELLRTRTSEKWTAYPPDVLPLFVAESDFPLAEPVASALHAAIDRSDTGYIGDDGGATTQAFASFARRRWGWDVDSARVRTTTDVSVVIAEGLRALIEPGDGVVIMPPVYPPFFELIPEAGGRVVEAPLARSDDGGYRIDLDAVERALASGARAVLLCNPHNPLGLVHTRDELTALSEVVDRHGAVVLSDEIHAPLTHSDATFVPYLTVSEAAREHTIAAHSASKAFNLAGLKCALFVTASDRTTALVEGLPEEVEVRTSLFGRMATTAAFEHGDAWLDGVVASIEDNRRRLASLLAERMPSVGYLEPRASYLTWLDLSALGWGEDPAPVALERARVAVNSGLTFGREGAGFVRLNIGCSPEVLTEAVDRLARAAA